MFSKLFGSKKSESPGKAPDTVFKQELDALEQRWYAFLDKLEEKHRELVESIETEGPAMLAADTDPYKRAFYRFRSGVDGQLDNIRKKAYDTCDTQIRDYYQAQKRGVMDASHDLLYAWRERCFKAHDAFEKRISAAKDQVWARVDVQDDPEEKYKAILEEYDRIRDQFRCKQCGSPLTIDKIFFISTYITCPSCQTQNTFEPSTQARSLEHLARELAEKRTAPLLAAYNAEKNLDHELYNQMHQLKFSSVPADEKAKRLAEMGSRQQQAVKDAPDLYRKYLRAMFDEWNSIIPDLKEQNERFYERQLADFNRMND